MIYSNRRTLYLSFIVEAQIEVFNAPFQIVT